jgi:predicted nicotinamide N-methyase
VTSPAAVRTLLRLRARLAAKFRMIDVPVTLPLSGVTYRVLQPATFDRLLTAAARDPEQNLPYWATIWPSGIALADVILSRPRVLAGLPAVEIGSGLGITAAAAIEAGADLLATDYSPETLLLCRTTALRNTGREPRTLRFNWRQPAAAFLDRAPWPLVLAADVLYERRDVMPLLRLIEQLVAPGGMLWLAEPGRPPAKRFVELALGRGWRNESVQHAGPWPDPQDEDVIVTIHLLRR